MSCEKASCKARSLLSPADAAISHRPDPIMIVAAPSFVVELAKVQPAGLLGWKPKVLNHTTAIFRQINKQNPQTHHDALEFPHGQTVLLTGLAEGQEATVLQLPAQPATPAEMKAQEHVLHVG